MASTISAGTTSGTAIAIAGDTSGALAFQTNNGTTAVTIDTSQNVGIGTSSPTDNLYISRATNSAGGISVVNTNNAQANQIAQLYLQGGDNAYAQIKLQASSVNSSIRGNNDGSLAFLSSTTERMRIGSNGSVAIGTTDTTTGAPKVAISGGTQTYNLLTITDTDTNYSTSNRYAAFYNSSGSFAGSIQHTGATAVTYATSSDERLKENIVDAPNALEKVANMPVRSYDWKEDKTHVEYGFVAQELNNIYSEPVGVGGNDVKEEPWSIEYGRLTPILVKAIQELNAKVEAQATIIAELQAKLGA